MYAARVKKIVNNASKAAESEEVAKLKAIIKRLQSGQAVAIEEIDGGTLCIYYMFSTYFSYLNNLHT